MNKTRWLTLAWLILSQLGSLTLLLLPWIVAFTLSALMMAGGVFYIVYVCLAPIIPILLIAISWLLFARRKDLAAALTSGFLLLLSIAAFVAYSVLIES
ncbi:MAG: hypothetical protein ACOY0R_20930 [Chloroflexota bacterium]